MGETRFELQHDDHVLYFEGLVVSKLESDLVAGIPFMECNDIAVRPLKREVTIAGKTIFNYDSGSSNRTQHSVCCVAALIVKITLNVKIFTLRVNNPPLM